jgi:hypothetical protein
MPASAGSIPAVANGPRQGQLGHREHDGEEQNECLDLVGVVAARVRTAGQSE